ncbi:MAG TPA: ABC transporter permease [Gemmatimonadales bacterium]|nr:ABC transporter permease [Gemmatimonadales bacterium]
METLRLDLRLAVRSLAASPLFTAIVVGTLTLAIGATTAVYGVLYGALLRPAPFPDAGRLMVPFTTGTPLGARTQNVRWSFGRYRLLRREQTVFADLAAYGPVSLNLTAREQPERLEGEVVSASYFATLRVPPAIGRTFLPEEDSIPGAHPAVILAHDLWLRRFGGDPGVVGRVITLEDQPLTVVGVMPAGFRGLSGHAGFWTPQAMAPLLSYREYLTTNQNFISVIARLRDGMRPEAARAELAVLGPRIQAELPSEASAPVVFGATAVSLDQARVDPTNRSAVLVLFGSAMFLLVIASANLASLQLGRAIAKQRETAVRLALGAPRWRLVRQLLTESILLAGVGGIAGVVLAMLLLGWLTLPERVLGVRGGFGQLGEFADARIDPAVLGVALALALGTTVLFGLLPALRATRPDLARELREGGGGSMGKGLSLRRLEPRALIVVAEMALALTLCIGAGLMVKSFRRMVAVDRGFDPSGLLTFRIQPSDARYPAPEAPALIERLLQRVAAVPGVASVTVDAGAPFDDRYASSTLFIAGRPLPAPGAAPPVTRHYVGPDHFRTLGIPLLHGRGFTPADRAGSPHVTIINRTAAERFWPGRDPLGQRVWFGGGSTFSSPDSSAEIVGVVGDVPYGSIEYAGSQASFYTPYLQFTYAFRTVMARTAGDPLALVPAVRAAVAAAEPGLPIFEVRTMQDRLTDSWARARFNSGLLSAFAVLALGFAAMGLFGAIAHSVSRRSREIGIRMAVGGAPGKIAWMVIREGLAIAGVGLVFGLLGAFALTRFLKSLLYGVPATDPVVYAVLCLLLGAVALLALAVPARRATRVDPLTTLRAE